MSAKEHDRWDYDRSPLGEEDRKKVLARIHSALYWVGKFVPEEEMLDDRRIPLRDIIYRFISNPDPSEQEIRDALSLADHLEKKARKLEEELKSREDLTKGGAHMLLDEICGLLRAVDEIRTSDRPEAQLKVKELMSRLDDERRWQEFLKSVSWVHDLGH